MAEKRAEYRPKLFKAGRLEFTQGSVDCIVRNLTSNGATVEVLTSCGIPHELTLEVVSHKLRFDGYVVWRKPNHVGIAFRAHH